MPRPTVGNNKTTSQLSSQPSQSKTKKVSDVPPTNHTKQSTSKKSTTTTPRRTNPLMNFDWDNYSNEDIGDDEEITSESESEESQRARGLPLIRRRTEGQDEPKSISKPKGKMATMMNDDSADDSEDESSNNIGFGSDVDNDEEDDFDFPSSFEGEDDDFDFFNSGEGENDFDFDGEGEDDEDSFDDEDDEKWGDLDGDIESDDDYQPTEEEDPLIAKLRALVEKANAERAAKKQGTRTTAPIANTTTTTTTKNNNTKDIKKDNKKIQEPVQDDEDDDYDEDDSFNSDELAAFENQSDGEGEFDDFDGEEDDFDVGEGEFDSFFNDGEGEFDDEDFEEDSGDEIGAPSAHSKVSSGPMSITERLAAQLKALQGNTSNDDNNKALLFGGDQDPINDNKTSTTTKLNKQEKALAIRKQLLLYQQQLKIRLFLQQPQGYLEQLPLDPQMFVKLASIDLQDNGLPNVVLTSADKKKSKDSSLDIEMGLSESELMGRLKQGGKIRKLDSLLDNDLIDGSGFILNNYIEAGQVPYNLAALLKNGDNNNNNNNDSDDDEEKASLVDNFYKQPFVKKMKLSQAITAQTLGDLIKIEHMASKGAGAKEYNQGQMDDDDEDNDDDDSGKKKKKKNKDSDNLSATMLLSDMYQDLIESNQLLKGLTAKATAGVITESIESNLDIFKENQMDNRMGDDDSDDANEQDPMKQLSKQVGKFKKDQTNSQLLLSSYENDFDQIEDYLAQLYTTSLPRVNSIIDKWEKRTNAGLVSSLGSNFDLSSLSVPLSQQINTTLVTEQRRLLQKSRLRRFSLHQHCLDPTTHRNRQQRYYEQMVGFVGDDDDDDEEEEEEQDEDEDNEEDAHLKIKKSELSQLIHQLGQATTSTATALAAQERFDDEVYDDFDFTATLIKDINTNLGDFNASKDVLNIDLTQLRAQQESIKRQIKHTLYEAQHGTSRHGERKQVKIGQVNQKAVNFIVPRVDINWARANGIEFNSSSNNSSTTDNNTNAVNLAMRESIDAMLGVTTNDAIFVDNLFLHLFGQQQNRQSRHANDELARQRNQEQSTTKDDNDDDGGEDNDEDNEDFEDEDDFDYGDDDNDDESHPDGNDDDDDSDIDINEVNGDEAEYGGGSMGSWF